MNAKTGMPARHKKLAEQTDEIDRQVLYFVVFYGIVYAFFVYFFIILIFFVDLK